MNHQDRKTLAFGCTAASSVVLCIVTAAFALAGCTARGVDLANCPFEANRSATVAVGDAEEVKISAGSGQLVVRGLDGLAEVRVQGRACAEGQEQLDRIQVATERRGDRILIKSNVLGSSSSSPGSWPSCAGLDLEIDVPKSLALVVSHGSGSMELRGVGPLRISDGSGNIRIEDASGDARITDGSGNVIVRGMQGSLVVSDGSGHVSVGEVAGEVEVKDGSGDISIDRVSQDVTVFDGTGEIAVENLDASVTIIDSTGDIAIRQVGQDVDIVDSSGDVSVSDVGGDLTVRHNCSVDVQYSDVKGRVSVPERGC